MRDWAQTFGVAVRQVAKAGTLPKQLDQAEIQPGEPLSFEISDFKEQQKKQKNRRRRKWDIRVQFPSSDEESDESFPDNETACDDGPSIFGTRDSFSPRKIFPTWEEVFASTAELCSIDSKTDGLEGEISRNPLSWVEKLGQENKSLDFERVVGERSCNKKYRADALEPQSTSTSGTPQASVLWRLWGEK